MPFATRDGCRLYWKADGDPGKPPLVLLNSIGTDIGLWDRMLPYLLPSFRLLRMDARGHGASDSPPGDYTMEQLAADVLAVMDAARIDRAAVAGVSLGGMVAMTMALQVPDRIDALALICTSAEMDRSLWAERIETVRAKGTAEIADVVISRFFSPAFADRHPELVHGIRDGFRAMADDGYAGAGAAIRDMAIVERLGQIRQPVLVVAGRDDISTSFENHGRRISEAIAGSSVAHIAGAHLLPVEAPGALAAELGAFLLGPDVTDAKRQLYISGLERRREVLGDAWVDRSIEGRTPFTSDFQEMITRIAWQEVWTRAGLEERVRRLLVVAITASLSHWEEFGLHVRAGLEQGGFTADELKELLLQTAIYAGLPAANTAFAKASDILKDFEASQATP